jgi:hypothetical protein
VCLLVCDLARIDIDFAFALFVALFIYVVK